MRFKRRLRRQLKMFLIIYPLLIFITFLLTMLTIILEMCPFVSFGLFMDIIGFVTGLGSLSALIALTERFTLEINREA